VSKQTRRASASRGRRIGLIAITSAALAIAGTAAWMTLGASSATPIASSPAAAPQAQAAPTASPASGVATAPTAAQMQAATALAAQTHTTPPAAATSRPTAVAAQPQAAAPGVAGQQAFIDPATGKLRPAEHDDVAALSNRTSGLRRLARTAQTASEPQEFATEGGAMGVVVPDELQPYTVATRTADGKVVIQHVTGGKAATAKVRENTKKGGMTIDRKGEANDR
jgi:hypothetical protein